MSSPMRTRRKPTFSRRWILYSTRDEEIELTAAQRAEIGDYMVRQARESGFAEQAAQYLTELALETDGFQELSDMGLSSYSITDADGALVQSCDLTLYSAVSRPLLDKDHINISATVNVGSLKHFADRYGIRAELSIEFSTTVEGKNGNSIEINMTAVFEQEVLLTVNTSGGAIWKWKWIFPYIYDYRLNANIDVGTYTGIAITGHRQDGRRGRRRLRLEERDRSCARGKDHQHRPADQGSDGTEGELLRRGCGLEGR